MEILWLNKFLINVPEKEKESWLLVRKNGIVRRIARLARSVTNGRLKPHFENSKLKRNEKREMRLPVRRVVMRLISRVQVVVVRLEKIAADAEGASTDQGDDNYGKSSKRRDIQH